jgi:DtxR family Mn-dependent transcriptional regulator
MVRRLSQSVGDYLKTIYKIHEAGEPVSKSQIASKLGVSAASVTNMMKRLSEMGLVRHESYGGVTLTAKGTQAALEIVRHHRLLETYLKEVMGYSWHEMHEEAENLEHHISESFESKLDEMLGYPTHDPHGHPIPSLDGSVEAPPTIRLADAPTGQSLTVHHIGDSDPDVLSYLEEIGLMPRARVKLLDKAPFDGPLTIRIENRSEVIGNRVAGDVFVIADRT